jgi:UDP-glucose 4-epimerase
MNILVTGSEGFVGKYLVKELEKKEHNVYCIDRVDITRNKYFIHDLSQKPSDELIQVLNEIKFGALIHLAAAKGDYNLMYEDFYRDNVTASDKLINLVKVLNVKSIIMYSTVSVYGHDNKIMSEDASLKPNNPYGISKLTCENYIRFFKNKYNLNAIIIRPSFVISPNMNRNPLYDILSNFKAGKVNLFQSIKSNYNFVLASTVCGVINDILLKNIHLNEINVVNKINTSLSEVVKYLKNEGYKFDVVSNEDKIVNQTLDSLNQDLFLQYKNDIFKFCDNYIKNKIN